MKTSAQIGEAFRIVCLSLIKEYHEGKRVGFFEEDSELIIEAVFPESLAQTLDEDTQKAVTLSLQHLIEERMREAVSRRMEDIDSQIGEFVAQVAAERFAEFLADPTKENLDASEEAELVLAYLKLETEEFQND